MQFAVGEILVCGVVRVDRFGAQRGKHVHLNRSACVHRHDSAPHVGDQRAWLTYYVGKNVFRFGIVDFVQRGCEQSFLTADIMQYASLGESYAIGDFLQGSAVIAERSKQFDGRIENLRSSVDFFVGHDDSLSCLSLMAIHVRCNAYESPFLSSGKYLQLLYGRLTDFSKKIGVL